MTGAIRLVLVTLALLFAAPASPQALETEAPIDREMREIAMDLRCPVCQGQSLFDSNSGLAAEMRDLIREQLRQGRSRQEVVDYFVARYGNFVRMAPETSGPQLAIWLWPFIACLVATLLLFVALRRREQGADPRPATTADPTRILDQFEAERR